jgi:6-pyruvoyl-tetrahydropterin synthase
MARLFVERLTVIDFSFLEPRRGVVGESWIMDVELEGELDQQGMVFDFSEVKKTIKNWVDNELDHRLVVPGAAGGYYRNTEHGMGSLTFRLDDGNQIQHVGPADSVAVLNRLAAITPPAVAKYIEAKLKQILPKNISLVDVNLTAEKISGHYYHYTHGLQKHQGNCQRIAHGHRSKIQIEINGARSDKWEKHWADLFRDIYIGTRSHVVTPSTGNYTRFEYLAEQGKFSIEIPTRSCYLIDTETTVELLASHIAEEMTGLVTGKIKVTAFEGVGKGAIATTVGKQK